MYNCPPPRPPFNPFNGFFLFIAGIVLAIMIFWQTLLVLIFPFRFNVFVLLIELALLFFIIYRVIWPH